MLPTPRRLVALTWPLIILLAAEHCDAGFKVTDLGALGDSSSSGIAGINSQGAAAGTVYGVNGPVAVSWSPAGIPQPVSLQGLPAGASYATGIADGGAVVGTYYNTVDRTYHAFRSANGKATDLGAAAFGLPSRASSYGVAINAAGGVAGTAYGTDGTATPFRTQGVSPTIKLPDGSMVGRATGINQAGTVVGSYLDARGTWHVFTAAADQTSAADPLRGLAAAGFNSNMYGSAINAQGAITGFGDINGQKHAFFVSGTTFNDIKPVSGFTSTRSTALNDAGLVVGQMDGSANLSHAFIWAPPGATGQPGTTFDLNSLLSAADRQVWTLTVATGINDSNQISGQGYVDGVLHGFVLEPTSGTIFSPAVVPAPPSAAMALAGLALVGGWCRLRRGRTAGRGSV